MTNKTSNRLTPEKLREHAATGDSVGWRSQAQQLLRWAADSLETAESLAADYRRLQSDLAERDKVARDRLYEIERLRKGSETTPQNIHSDEWWQAELDRCVAVEQDKYRALFAAYMELKNGDPEVTAGLGSAQKASADAGQPLLEDCNIKSARTRFCKCGVPLPDIWSFHLCSACLTAVDCVERATSYEDERTPLRADCKACGGLGCLDCLPQNGSVAQQENGE